MSQCDNINVSTENTAIPVDQDNHHDLHLDKESRELIEKLTREIELLNDGESRLNHVIAFMESSLAQSGTPHFRCFWQARSICLQLFKGHIAPSSRSLLWQKYSELSKEARRLKSLLDEQSAFAVEQIEIAIQGLESEIASFAEKLSSNNISVKHIEGLDATVLRTKCAFYSQIQHELDHLNSYAARINALRKELIKTEMRIRKKNNFFQRLSSAGDLVFPRRKELIGKLSENFSQDIECFIAEHFNNQESRESLFTLREEIKALQNYAKVLTINTQTFTQTRMRLSECWDKLKHIEKERKKVRVEQKNVFKQNAENVLKQIEEVSQGVHANQFSTEEAQKKLDVIVSFMRTVELGREELQVLREKIAETRKPIFDQIKLAEEARNEKERAHLLQKKQRHLEFKQEIETFLRNAPQLDVEALTAERHNVIAKIQNSSFDKKEKNEFEHMLKPLRDLINDKKEQALLTLSDDDRQSLQQLKQLLLSRKERRQQIKEQLDSNRKASGSSGLDFQAAIHLKEQINADKERLEQIDQGITEIEEMIKDHERKVVSSQ